MEHTTTTATRQAKALIFDEVLLQRFVNHIDATEKTVNSYRKAIRPLFAFFLSRQIQSPERLDILAYKDKLIQDGKRPATVQNYLTVARLFFKWLADSGIYPNVAGKVKGLKISNEHKKDHLTSNQVKTLLSKIDRSNIKGLRDYAIVTLMITGGLRTVEISRANVEDLRALADNTVLYVHGKGKVEKSDYVKISPQTEQAIRSYLTKRGRTNGREPLFISTSNNRKGSRLSTRTISGLIKARLIDAGFNSERLTAHSLRHTAVTLSLLAGRDLAEVQQFARHSNITTTMIYNHALDKAKNACSLAISDAIFSTQHENNINHKSKRRYR